MTDSQPGCRSDDADRTDAFADPAAREGLLRSIRPDDARRHHDLLRSLLSAEAQSRTDLNDAEDHEFFENLYWCAFLLFCVGDPSDVPAIWQAKHLDFDTSIGLDAQALFGAGLDATLEWLRAHGHDDIADDLADYDPAELDLPRWRAGREHYFYG